MIDREDLLRYGNHALTYRIVDRIFEQVPRKFACEVEGKMGYEDFCWFILSEEDKTSDVSLEYWFDCVDLDCDGAIRPNEMLVRYSAPPPPPPPKTLNSPRDAPPGREGSPIARRLYYRGTCIRTLGF